jgi:uncharacterized protein YkwD
MILNIIRDWLANLAGRNRPVKPIPLPGPAPGPVPPPTPTPAPDGQDIVAGLVAAHNAARQARGLAPLVASVLLNVSAGKHAALMAARHAMAHQLPGEGDLASRAQDAGYSWSRIGENIAWNQPDVPSVMAAWLGDIPHRMNIMGQFREMGAAMVRASDGTPYWCCDFGTQQAAGFAATINREPTMAQATGDRMSCMYLSRE